MWSSSYGLSKVTRNDDLPRADETSWSKCCLMHSIKYASVKLMSRLEAAKQQLRNLGGCEGAKDRDGAVWEFKVVCLEGELIFENGSS
jgi:hypothetical protein